MSRFKVGLVQMSCSADVNLNMEKAIIGVREAASKGANVICLQELFTSLYFCDVEDYENFKLAECQHPACEFSQTCPEYLVAPIMERQVAPQEPVQR